MVLSPLVGKTEHYVKNSNEFAKEVRELKLEPDEELRSYYVSALFTGVLTDKVLEVIKLKLEENNTLSERTLLEPDIIRLLGLCLNCTSCFTVSTTSRSTGLPWAPLFHRLCVTCSWSLSNKRL